MRNALVLLSILACFGCRPQQPPIAASAAPAPPAVASKPQAEIASPQPEAPGPVEEESSDAEKAYFLAGEGEWEDAIPYLTKAIAKTPNDPKPFYYRGVAHDILEETDKSLADLSQCIRLDPKHARALYSRALVYRKQEKWDESFADLKLAAELEPDDFRIVNFYAQMLGDSPKPDHRNPKLAVELATRANELTDWKDPICLTTLATAYEASGDQAKAAEYKAKAQAAAEE